MHTKTKLLLQSDADEEKAQHVGEQMENSSMQPYASNQAPSLVSLYNFDHF